MVLSNMHLTVLRKLKKQGPLQTGIHPSVGALVKAGFVDELLHGYSITDRGSLALISYDEMDIFHRQILMQLHRNDAEQKAFNQDALKHINEQEAFDDLLRWELVTVDDKANISLTEAGRSLWQIALDAHALRDDTKSGFDAANEKQRAKKLERQTRLKTEPETWIENRLKQEKEEGFRAEVVGEFESEAPTVAPALAETTSAGDCPECSNCIDAEVLELLAAKYPKVKELRQALLQQKQILKELGL